MAKANEDKLGDLHGAIAQVLTAQIQHKVEETSFNENGEEVPTGEFMYTAAPATIAAGIKFLNDNNITCEHKTNTNMTNLSDALSKKQKRSQRLGDAKQAALRAVGDE